MHETAPAFKYTAGPHKARIVIVGEAWGESEEKMHQPFVGESGKELWRLLGEATQGGLPAPELHAAASALHKYDLAWVKERGAWLEAAEILLTNVVAARPPENKFARFCLEKKELPQGYDLPPIAKDGQKNLYLHPDYFGELNRLVEEITEAQPNIIIALGNPACWATLRAINITAIRGTVAMGVIRGIKVLPTFHPAAVLRQWSWRSIALADISKAMRESHYKEIRRPQRSILINPTLQECQEWAHRVLATAEVLSCDTETKIRQIEMISFAPSIDQALVVPFVDWSKPDGNYWPTVEDEIAAWAVVRRLLESPIPKLWQNTMYDAQYLLRRRIRPMNCLYDPMLKHHAIFPEMKKGLGFLGSVYTDEASWKLMRTEKMDTEKRDE